MASKKSIGKSKASKGVGPKLKKQATGGPGIFSNFESAKFSNKRNGLVSGYGANTNQGIVRNYNEDRVAIILNMLCHFKN